jgi:type II secretory pathway pseudopilin PulG
MLKRSLTLIEMLIAVVLLLAIAALVLPSMFRAMEERTFDAAAHQTEEQLRMARDHAQATGTPVEVTYRADKSEVQARFFGAGEGSARESGSTGSEQPGFNLGIGALSDLTASEAEAAELIPESWACRGLGPGMRLVARPPADSSDDAASTEVDVTEPSAGEYETLDDLGRGQDVRLAVFMPDGSALVGDPIWLNDDKGRRGMFTINPWSGLPAFQRMSDHKTGAADPSDEKNPLGDDLRETAGRERDSAERGDDSEPAPSQPARPGRK